MLNPSSGMPRPKWSAETARSCPMIPSRGGIPAVVSNPSVLGSTLRRSSEALSSLTMRWSSPAGPHVRGPAPSEFHAVEIGALLLAPPDDALTTERSPLGGDRRALPLPAPSIEIEHDPIAGLAETVGARRIGV